MSALSIHGRVSLVARGVLTVAAALFCARAALADARFFPKQPAGAAILSSTGILTDFGVGNSIGTFTLREAVGSHDYYVGEKTLLERKAIDCSQAPTPSYTPKQDECAYWPHDIVIGKTRVRISYWMQKRPDTSETVRVAQAVDPIADASVATNTAVDTKLAHVKALTRDARSGDRMAFAKLAGMLAQSDGAVAEAVVDGIARASTAQPKIALASFAALSPSARRAMLADPDAVCGAGEARAFASVHATSAQTQALQKNIVSTCANPTVRSQTP